MRAIRDILGLSPVIPVVTLGDPEHAVPIAEALLAGGVGIIEVTLHSDSALTGIRRIRQALPEMCVGAGTVWDAAQASAAVEAGSAFLVSPGIADPVLEVARLTAVPLLPGAQTASEVQHWRRQGLEAVKFFPAEPAGGLQALKALAAIFPGLAFCPTGGITASKAQHYLALDCVPAVGGSWLAPANVLAAGDWNRVRDLAREAIGG